MAEESQELKLIVTLVDNATPGLLKLKQAVQQTIGGGTDAFKSQVDEVGRHVQRLGDEHRKIREGIGGATKDLVNFASQMTNLPIADFARLAGSAALGFGGIATALAGIPLVLREMEERLDAFVKKTTDVQRRGAAIGMDPAQFRVMTEQLKQFRIEGDEAQNLITGIFDTLSKASRPGPHQAAFMSMFGNPAEAMAELNRLQRLAMQGPEGQRRAFDQYIQMMRRSEEEAEKRFPGYGRQLTAETAAKLGDPQAAYRMITSSIAAATEAEIERQKRNEETAKDAAEAAAKTAASVGKMDDAITRGFAPAVDKFERVAKDFADSVTAGLEELERQRKLTEAERTAEHAAQDKQHQDLRDRYRQQYGDQPLRLPNPATAATDFGQALRNLQGPGIRFEQPVTEGHPLPIPPAPPDRPWWRPFQHGGIVTKPMHGLVGEAGPEAIIPLSSLGDRAAADDRREQKKLLSENTDELKRLNDFLTGTGPGARAVAAGRYGAGGGGGGAGIGGGALGGAGAVPGGAMASAPGIAEKFGVGGGGNIQLPGGGGGPPGVPSAPGIPGSPGIPGTPAAPSAPSRRTAPSAAPATPSTAPASDAPSTGAAPAGGPLTAGAKGKVDPAALKARMAQLFKGSKLEGYVPPDGAKYGFKTGSAEEWASFATQLAEHESSFKTHDVGDKGLFGGAGSRGLFQLSPQDAPNYGFGKAATLAQLEDPEYNAQLGAKIIEKRVLAGGITGSGLQAYFGGRRNPYLARGEVTTAKYGGLPIPAGTTGAAPTGTTGGPPSSTGLTGVGGYNFMGSEAARKMGFNVQPNSLQDMVTRKTAVGTITANKYAADDMAGFINDLHAAGAPLKDYSGVYVPKKIQGTNRTSQHAYGNAIDIETGYGSGFDNSPALYAWAQAHPKEFADIQAKHHMRNLINAGRGKHDWGHFEWTPSGGTAVAGTDGAGATPSAATPSADGTTTGGTTGGTTMGGGGETGASGSSVGGGMGLGGIAGSGLGGTGLEGLLGGGGLSSILGMIGGGKLGGILGMLGGGRGLGGILSMIGGGRLGGLGNILGMLGGGSGLLGGGNPLGSLGASRVSTRPAATRAPRVPTPRVPTPAQLNVPLPKPRPGIPGAPGDDYKAPMFDTPPSGEFSGAAVPGPGINDIPSQFSTPPLGDYFHNAPFNREGSDPDPDWRKKGRPLEQQASLRDGRLLDRSAAMTHRVEGSGRIDVNVNAPAGTNVRARGGGIFKSVAMNRQTQMPSLHSFEPGPVG